MKKTMLIAVCVMLAGMLAAEELPLGKFTRQTGVKLVKDGAGKEMIVAVKAGKPGYAMAQYQFPIADYAGKTLKFSCEYKLDNVVQADAKKNWTGAKFMLTYAKADGKRVYPEKISHRAGTVDWTAASFTEKVPAGAQNPGIFQVGIQEGTGTASFRNVKMEVVESN